MAAAAWVEDPDAARKFFAALQYKPPGTGSLNWQRRTRSWSPKSFATTTASVDTDDEIEDDDDSAVLFDDCRFPRPVRDVLECAIACEPWQDASGEAGKKIRVVGEVGALRKLFSMPLHGGGDALCVHRVGDSLIVVDAAESIDDELHMAYDRSAQRYSPRSAGLRCQVRLEGDMVRVYPKIAPAEPVDAVPVPTAASTATACCEWRVRDGLSLFAITPHDVSNLGDSSEACEIEDLRGAPPRLVTFDTHEVSQSPSNRADAIIGLEGTRDLRVLQTARSSALPAYHKQVTEDHVAVMVVSLGDLPRTQALVDAWLSCCLFGSPSLLCFFVDHDGVCRGCRFVAAAEIPDLGSLAAAYRADYRCLAATPASSSDDGLTGENATAEGGKELGMRAFNPKMIREGSRGLLETLVSRCDQDGGHFIVLPGPLGSLRVLGAPPPEPLTECDDEDSAESAGKDAWTLALLPLPTPPVPLDALPGVAEPASVPQSEQRRRCHVSQALLMYHAAVRLAQPRVPTASSDGSVKGVPSGSRWTAKSCQHPRRVRQMMLRAVTAATAASACGEEGSNTSEAAAPTESCKFVRRFLLLLGSAREFLADTYLAEDAHSDDKVDASRYEAALRHLRRSTRHLEDYVNACSAEKQASDAASAESDGLLSQSVRRLEERVLAKRTNAHLCLARIRQRQHWCGGKDATQATESGRDGAEVSRSTPLRELGQALGELDAADKLVADPPRTALPARTAGPYERSLLASIAKWKADILHELASLCPAAAGDAKPCLAAVAHPLTAGSGSAVEQSQTVDPITLRDYLEEQLRITDGEASAQLPLAAQQERWLQSAISLSLRSLHQLTSLPSEVTDELQLQARALLARAYGDLGLIYASTGRYTKAMTHAKQGIELFNATKDKFHAAMLQLWLCRLQLRMAVPQAASSGLGGGGADDAFLLRGCSAVGVGGAEDTACSQVAAALQRALKGLEEGEAERLLRREGQALLGRVLLRQSLARLAHGPSQLCAICRFCEEDTGGVLTVALELLQATEQSDGGAVALSDDGVREAVELLLQAGSCFREAGDQQLAAASHTCLAAVYLCSGADGRVQRLALTHCQHAQEHLQEASTASSKSGSVAGVTNAATSESLPPRSRLPVGRLRLPVRLLEAKALRRAGAKLGIGGSSASSSAAGGFRASADAKVAALLCDIAVDCHRSPPASPRDEVAGAGPTTAATAAAAKIPGGSCDGQAPPTSEEEQLPPPPRALAGDDQRRAIMSYLRHELSDVLVRLVRSVGAAGVGNAGAGGGAARLAPCRDGRELKALYCSLLTAWHAEAAQVDALVALRDHLRGTLAPTSGWQANSTDADTATGPPTAQEPADPAAVRGDAKEAG